MVSERKEEGEEAFDLAEKMLSPPLLLASSACIFLLCVVAFEWEHIWGALVRLLE